MLTEFDHQQLLLIKQRIDSFEHSLPCLDSLLSITRSLEELLDSLKMVDPQWKSAFKTEWWELEFTSSLMMDEERDELTQEDRKAVEEALENMKALIESILTEEKS